MLFLSQWSTSNTFDCRKQQPSVLTFVFPSIKEGYRKTYQFSLARYSDVCFSKEIQSQIFQKVSLATEKHNWSFHYF